MMRRHEMEWWIFFFKELENVGFFRKDVKNDV